MTLDQLNEIINKGVAMIALMVIVFVLAFHFWGKTPQKEK